MTKELICVVDRVDDGVAVLIPASGEEPLEVYASRFPFLRENTGCIALLNDSGELIDIIEAEKKPTNNKDRLMRLFDKSKNKEGQQ